MIWASKKKIDSCAKHRSYTYNEKSPVRNAEFTALPTGQLLCLEIGTFDLAFVFTYNYDDNFYIILFG